MRAAAGPASGRLTDVVAAHALDIHARQPDARLGRRLLLVLVLAAHAVLVLVAQVHALHCALALVGLVAAGIARRLGAGCLALRP